VIMAARLVGAAVGVVLCASIVLDEPHFGIATGGASTGHPNRLASQASGYFTFGASGFVAASTNATMQFVGGFDYYVFMSGSNALVVIWNATGSAAPPSKPSPRVCRALPIPSMDGTSPMLGATARSKHDLRPL
jgi:hypothetical protein